MKIRKIITLCAIIMLIVGNLFFAVMYFSMREGIQQLHENIQSQKMNLKVIAFTNLFVNEVLKSDKEVSFETRLQLENMVRDIKDPEILSQWQKFVASKTESEAQVEVKNLLSLLVGKIEG